MAAASVVAGGCAQAIVEPIGTASRPFAPAADERALWAQAGQEAERLLGRSGRYEDPALADYLGHIGRRLLPAAVRTSGAPPLAISVLRDPTLNAFALPDGRLFVHTGLLSRVENEAQLAAVLARETVHVTHRHALRLARTARGDLPRLSAVPLSGEDATALPEAAALVAPSPTAAAVRGLGLRLTAIAAVVGYPPEMERQADAEGMDRLALAGYDPRQMPRLFESLAAEARSRGPLEAFRLGGAAHLRARAASLRELLAVRYPAAAVTGGGRATGEFQDRMRSVVRDNAVLDMRAGRFRLAHDQLRRVLADAPGDPLAHVYEGDLFRLQAQRVGSAAERADLGGRARASYERAAALDPALPAPFRQLGLLYYQQGDLPRAREAFARYLAIGPTAPDADRVREYVSALERVKE